MKKEEAGINTSLLKALKQKIKDKGYVAEFSPKDGTIIIINSELEVSSAIRTGDYHPSTLPAYLIVIHHDYFPKGISSDIVGFGDTLEQKIESTIETYLNTLLEPIIDSLSDNQSNQFDFKSNSTDREIAWHTKIGDSLFKGNWDETTNLPDLYSILEVSAKNNLVDQKLNWLELEICKNLTGEVHSSCLLNGKWWNEGQELLKKYVESWKDKEGFLKQQQFVVFRQEN